MSIWKRIWQVEWAMAAIGAGGCLLVAMLLTVVMVLGRYVLQADLVPGGYNFIERVLFPLMVFLALPVAHREGLFPRLETLPDMLGPRWGRVLGVLALAIEVVVYLVLLWFVGKFAWASYLSNRPMQIGTVFWPLWPVLMVIPLSVALMILEMLRLFWRDAGLLLRRAEDGPHDAGRARP